MRSRRSTRRSSLSTARTAGVGSLTADWERFFELKRIEREEEPRRVSLEVTEEELVIFDILTRPAPALNAAARAEVKKVARDLLNRR